VKREQAGLHLLANANRTLGRNHVHQLCID